MAVYYLGKKAQGDGEYPLHMESCEHLPDRKNREFVGFFSRCRDALETARRYYDRVVICPDCCTLEPEDEIISGCWWWSRIKNCFRRLEQ